MGWSCGAKASNVLQAWSDKCFASTGMSNVWQDHRGLRFFYEVSSREHDDGAITGSIMLEQGHKQGDPTTVLAVKYTSFRIEGDGRITRAPKFLKDVVVNHSNLDYGIGSGG